VRVCTRASKKEKGRARFGRAQHDAILQPAGIWQPLPRATPRSGVSTLDSIQCHSISQCNAHAAAYRCVSSVKRPPFPAGASRVKCPACNRSVHQGAREYGHVGEPLLYTDFIFQLHFVAYSWMSPRGVDLVWKTVVQRDCQRANVASTTVTIDLCALASAEMVSSSVIFQF